MNEVRPLRAYAEVRLGRQRSPEQADGPFMVPYLRAANVTDGKLALEDVLEMNFAPKEQEVFALRAGDVLVTEGSGSLLSVGASAVWNDDRPGLYCFQNTLLRLRSRGDTEPRFLAWWCRHAFASGKFASIATGANIFHVSAERVRSLPMTYVTREAQRTIADYLDRETARIEALIVAKHRMIGLVAQRLEIETRQRLLAVDHVLAPLKRTWRIFDCKHVTPAYVDSGFPVVSPGDVTAGRLDLSRANRFVNQADFDRLTDGGRRPRRGDIIYSRNASIGIASYVDTDEPFCMGQDVCLITSDGADQLFLSYVLNSLGLDQLEELKVGSTFSRVNVAQIAELDVPTPEVEDQRRVVRQIDASTRRSNEVTSRLHRQIQLLGERRQALITAAVTGSLQVPVAA